LPAAHHTSFATGHYTLFFLTSKRIKQ